MRLFTFFIVAFIAFTTAVFSLPLALDTRALATGLSSSPSFEPAVRAQLEARGLFKKLPFKNPFKPGGIFRSSTGYNAPENFSPIQGLNKTATTVDLTSDWNGASPYGRT